MKFSSPDLLAVLLALPVVAVQACDLRLERITNWSEVAFRIYRVTLITTPRNDDHLGIFCGQLSQVGARNVQCFWENGRYLADASFVEGSSGHGYVLFYFFLLRFTV